MTSASSLLRSVLIYSICLPLAVFLGYLMAEPLTTTTFATVGFVLFFLMIPLFLRWHHIWLIASWNLGAVLFFLPGRPAPWLAMSAVSLLIAVIQYILNRRLKFLHAPQVARPLIFLAVVVLVTMKCTGGFNLGIFGSDLQGGKNYILVLGAIIGYFALTSQVISPKRAGLCVALYFLGSLANAMGELAPVIAPSFYFIFLLFPVSTEGFAAIMNDPGASSGGMARLGGLAVASTGIFCAMLGRYGIREMFSLRRMGQLAIFAFFIIISMFGGFRSMLMLLLLTFGILFYLEGLMRSHLLPMFILLMGFGGAMLVPLADRLPLSMQRTLSFLPIEVNPIVRMSADTSTEWRLKMWHEVLPQIPHYLILGKGYSFDYRDVELIKAAHGDSIQGAEVAGNYHNGPLTLILPLGIFGVMGFLWFVVASIRVMHQNYQYGPAEYRRLNRLLLSYFIAKVIFFFCIFGSFHTDLVSFTGLIGLSISLNGGVARRATAPQPKLRLHGFRLPPATRRAIGAL